jgi:hypothetical protein
MLKTSLRFVLASPWWSRMRSSSRAAAAAAAAVSLLWWNVAEEYRSWQASPYRKMQGS